MTPELPAKGSDGIEQVGGFGSNSARTTGKPGVPTARPGSSDSGHPLPTPWPQSATSQPFPDAEDVIASPSVRSERWLAEPDYWMADHQRIPRPPTRPIARPQRFRRMSRMQSALLAMAILIGVMGIGAGMVMAGRFSEQFFNRPAPTAQPAHATQTIPTKTP